MTLHYRYFSRSIARAGPLPKDASIALQAGDDSYRAVLRLMIDGRSLDVALANRLVDKVTAEQQAATWRGFFGLS